MPTHKALHSPHSLLFNQYKKIIALFILIFLVLSSLFLANFSYAQRPSDDTSDQIKVWQSTVTSAKKALDSNFIYVNSKTIIKQLNETIQEVKEVESTHLKKRKDQQEQLDKLVASDSKKEDEEQSSEQTSNSDTEFSELKKEYEKTIDQYSQLITRIRLILSDAEDTLDKVSVWEQAWVKDQILQRNPTPLNPSVWLAAVKNAESVTAKILDLSEQWWQEKKHNEQIQLHLLWILPLIGCFIAWPLNRLLIRRFSRDPNELEPSYTRRILKCAMVSVTNAVIPVALILIELILLNWIGLLTGLFGTFIKLSAISLATFILVYGMAKAALAPDNLQWRIIPVSPAYTAKLLYAIGTVFGLISLGIVIVSTAWAYELVSPSLEASFYVLITTVTAFAIRWLLTPKYWTTSITDSQKMGTAEEHAEALEEAEEELDEATLKAKHSSERRKSIWLRSLRFLHHAILITPLFSLVGYGRLSFYLQSRFMLTIAAIGIVMLLRLALYEAFEQIVLGQKKKRRDRRSKYKKSSEEPTNDPETEVKIMAYWAGLAINLMLIIPAVYLLLFSYGVPSLTLKLWTQSLLAGLTVGSITFSITQIFSAVFILIAGLFITNWVRRWMTKRLLPNTRLDSGAKDSIASATSYLGVAIAIILSILSLGIDFSSLAIVAGALSVGIGFGLQNLVQNFVAGLMLLIERPIRVGDWIKVGSTEGTVVRISVRSTEVETFDRSSVFIPNSDLIANQVINWTHNNRRARIILKIHTDTRHDPEDVESLLLECARQHNRVLWYPAPYTWFRGFENGVLNFELRVYINNSDYWIPTESELYTIVYQRFKEAGIIIPVPQREYFLGNNNIAKDINKDESEEQPNDLSEQNNPSST